MNNTFNIIHISWMIGIANQMIGIANQIGRANQIGSNYDIKTWGAVSLTMDML